MDTPGFSVDREKLEITQMRIFDAPRERVWRAMTDPQSIVQWWGPAYYSTTVERMDVREGGKWRFIQHDPYGKRHAFRGEYREVAAPGRLVQTFEYEGLPGRIMVESATLEQLPDGKTQLTTRSQFARLKDLEEMNVSDMERGATESMDRLAALLAREAVTV